MRELETWCAAALRGGGAGAERKLADSLVFFALCL